MILKIRKVNVFMTSHNLKELRVAGILDELSCFCFPYECKFLELDIVNYIERMEEFKPQLLFIESAWHGLKNHWYTKVYNLSIEIREILIWCREHKVPTVFGIKKIQFILTLFWGLHLGLTGYIQRIWIVCRFTSVY